MAWVTDEQISEARKITLLEHFQATDPGALRHTGGGRYIHKDHDSYVIDNGKGQWYWNSRTAGGFSYLDYLMRIEGMEFLDAVRYLTDGDMSTSRESRKPPQPQAATEKQQAPRPQPAATQKPVTLPKPADSNDNMIAYLQNRGISESTTRKYINQGLLYESANNSCVFVGRDPQDDNKPKYAAERSITGDGKKDAAASNKAFSFCLPPDSAANSNTVAVFESGIDALSHHDLMKIANAESGTNWDGYRLSLAGTASIALTSFLERHPHVQNIFLCLDNDTPGQTATERITKELLSDKRFAGKNIIIAPPSNGKDFNDTLKGIRKLLHELNPDKHNTRETRQQAGFSI